MELDLFVEVASCHCLTQQSLTVYRITAYYICFLNNFLFVFSIPLNLDFYVHYNQTRFSNEIQSCRVNYIFNSFFK